MADEELNSNKRPLENSPEIEQDESGKNEPLSWEFNKNSSTKPFFVFYRR